MSTVTTTPPARGCVDIGRLRPCSAVASGWLACLGRGRAQERYKNVHDVPNGVTKVGATLDTADTKGSRSPCDYAGIGKKRKRRAARKRPKSALEKSSARKVFCVRRVPSRISLTEDGRPGTPCECGWCGRTRTSPCCLRALPPGGRRPWAAAGGPTPPLPRRSSRGSPEGKGVGGFCREHSHSRRCRDSDARRVVDLSNIKKQERFVKRRRPS